MLAPIGFTSLLRRCLSPGLLLLAFLAAGAPVSAASLAEEVEAGIARVLDGPEKEPVLFLGRTKVPLQPDLPAFYRGRDFRPAWVTPHGISSQGEVLLDLLRGAGEEGLCPADYHLAPIESLLGVAADAARFELVFEPLWMTQLDLLLTDAFLLYTGHLIEGRVDPEEVHVGWYSRPRRADLARLLQYALEAGRLGPVLHDLSPPHPGYARLREALAAHRTISALGGWPQVPPGPVLRPGEKDPRVSLLRNRLFFTGDLASEPDSPPDLFDPGTASALRGFQNRHGLEADGVFGPRTLEELNRPVEERIRQLEVNMERWRWLPKSLGDPHLAINIADFNLEVVASGTTVMSMPVVVGTAYRKTPVFSGWMSYLEFAPYWNVPPTILREDLLPKIKSDQGFLARGHYEIVRWEKEGEVIVDPSAIDWPKVEARTFPGALRQKPGPWNPLGRVKFMFPNRFAVYLHDTPDRRLFLRDVRSFSSGCIRIERPLDLAQYLLEDKGWHCDRLLGLMAAGVPRQVRLPAPVPVHIQYWTAWVDETGRVNFREDVYLRDLDLEVALAERRRLGARGGEGVRAGP